jgi:flagellar basal-body rod protein FlgB
MSELLSKNVKMLEKMLDYTSMNHRVIANNIANVNTPGFKQSAVSFDGELKRAIENGENISAVKVKVFKPNIAATRADGNNVDIDLEMGKLTENSLMYKIYAQLLSRRIRGVKDAIAMAGKV